MLIQENRTSEFTDGYFLLSAAPLHWLENTYTPYYVTLPSSLILQTYFR